MTLKHIMNYLTNGWVIGFLLVSLIGLIILIVSKPKENFEKFTQGACQQKINVTNHCNDVPLYPFDLKPKVCSSETRPLLIPSESNLVPKYDKFGNNFKFNFKIPELKYDGIYSRKIINNKCIWSLDPDDSYAESHSYGTNKFLIKPKSLIGKTIIEPPECIGFKTGYPPSYYTDNCSESVPCTA